MTKKNVETGEENSEIEWHELRASVDRRELFSYQLGLELEVYRLRVLGNGQAELWIQQYVAGEPIQSKKDQTFDTADEAITFLHERELMLRMKGWRDVSQQAG